MGTAVFTGLLLLLAGTVEGVILGRQKRWGEMAVTSLIWLFASGYAFFVIAPFEAPSPARLIIEAISFLQELVFR